MSEPRGLTPEGRSRLVDALTHQAHGYLQGERSQANPFMIAQVEVRCSIRVNGETVNTAQRVDARAWSDPGLRETVIQSVRQQCALEVVKRFPPEVQIIA